MFRVPRPARRNSAKPEMAKQGAQPGTEGKTQTIVDGELVGLVAEGHELRPGGSGTIDIHGKRDSR